MKATLTTLLVIILSLSTRGTSVAQSTTTTVFKAIYEMKGTYRAESLKDKAKIPVFPVALEIYPDKSFFYSMPSMTQDSITHAVFEATNDQVKAQQESNKVANRSMDIHILSSFETGRSVVTHSLNFDHYRYEEEMLRPEWVIDDSVTETKSGYKCHKATADYFGRVWTVWFTPEVPTPAGPWKLWGLPGLIVEASEAEGIYSFSLSSFAPMDEQDSKIDCEKYLVLGEVKHDSKSKVRRLLQLYVTDMQKFFQMIFPGATVTIQDQDGKELRGEDLRNKFVDIEK
ncbi:GLPGLI family protein [Porphyromonas sp.]|uniref:GLPGLI family protein n=1 Tax=Porphyromonas sp. TaxID=1924944 RepID=UPI0026DAEE76|nr:GLPGLI family protein [Porphyromonas sp.]MDO4770594.1 GLPGLI family protein [Porphyromonas sp.]